MNPNLSLVQYNEAFRIQKAMETPVAQLFARALRTDTPDEDVKTYIEALHAMAPYDSACAESIFFLASVVNPAQKNGLVQ